MFYILISILAGVTIVITRNINSILAQKIGIFQSTLINYITGLFFSFIFLCLSNESLNTISVRLKPLPLWAYLGGLSGVIVIALSSYIIPRISAFYLTLLIFVGQLFTGIIIDYFTLNKLSSGKIIGGILVLSGLTYNLLLDRKKEAKPLPLNNQE